jgi:hypothetical protein
LAKKLKKNSLPSAADVALGKEAVTVDGGFFLSSAYVALAECPIYGTRRRNLCRQILCRVLFAECNRGFAECPKHSQRARLQ